MAMFDRFREHLARQPGQDIFESAEWAPGQKHVAAIILSSSSLDPAFRVMIIDAQNISEYYGQGCTEEVGPFMWEKIFGSLRLPSPHVWVEFCLPPAWSRGAGRKITNDANASIRKIAVLLFSPPELRFMAIHLVFEMSNSDFQIGVAAFLIPLTEAYEWKDGGQFAIDTNDEYQEWAERRYGNKLFPVFNEHYTALREQLASVGNYPFGVALTTLMFLHSKNVQLQATTPSARLQKKRVAHGKSPMATTHTICISSKQYQTGKAPKSSREAPIAYHLVRGHFADYREHGLFGKQKGVFWMPQHGRGRLKEKVSESRYIFRRPE